MWQGSIQAANSRFSVTTVTCLPSPASFSAASAAASAVAPFFVEECGKSVQLPLFQASAEHPAVNAIKDIDPDSMTPKEALQVLYKLKDMAKQDLHS